MPSSLSIRAHMRKLITILAVVGAIGCGGDSTGPSNDYPNVAGIYELAGTFDDLPADQITGTLTLVQPDRTSGNFGGSIVASVSSADVTINSGCRPYLPFRRVDS